MKNNYTAKWWKTIVFTLAYSTTVLAQVQEPFEELDLSSISSQFFYPQTLENLSVPDGSNYEDVLTFDEAARLFATFDKACLDPDHFISDYSSLHMEMFETAAIQNCLPLAILDINYHDFIPTVLSDGLIYLENDKFYDAPVQYTSPYVLKNALIPWLGADYFNQGDMRFIIKPEWYITNKDMPTSIQLDFDDGLGFRTIAFDEVIQVHYGGDDLERNIRIKINRPGNVLKGGNVLKELSSFFPCETTTFPFPNAAPWPTNGDLNYPWQIGIVYQGELVKGNAFTLTSEDGMFDKPFIFVEGIDFGYEGSLPVPPDIYRNGTFGWCEFSSGFVDPDPEDDRNYGYDMLHLMPEMLHEIRSYGYDIILVDFQDGADMLQKNSELVQEVIRLCNQYKTGEEPLIVAGASMGGVLTRHALRSMEINGEDHCTRLWLSMDAPHAGANIPIAMQGALSFFGDNGNPTAWTMFHHMLKRPAAMQLLNLQYGMGMAWHDAFYSELDAMGYPQHCRKVAFSNGLGSATEVYHDMFPLIDWECNSYLNDVAEVYLCPNSGDDLGFIARITMPAYGDNAEGAGSWLSDLPLLGSIDAWADFDDFTLMVIGDQPNLDYAPGGTRSSIRDLGKSLGSSTLGCPIAAHQFNDNHCFVSTTSALGLNLDDPNIGVEQLLYDHPELENFDNYFFAQAENERHVEITPYSKEMILMEVLSPDRIELGPELTSAYPNAGAFNFGKEGYQWIRNVHVYDGGVLSIHEDQLTHFGGESDFLNSNTKFSVVTNDCSPSEILVDQDGQFIIGSELNPLRTADLHLNRDSKLILGAGGTLRVYNESRIILNEGAQMVLHAGADVKIREGKIILNAGSKLILLGGEHNLMMDHAASRIELNGGVIELADGAQLNIQSSTGDCGRILVKGGQSDVIHNGVDCVLRMTGNGQDNTILEVEDYGRFGNSNWHDGEIVLMNGKVDLHSAGAISTDMKFTAQDVDFVSPGLIEPFADPASVHVWGNHASLENCNFNQVRVNLHESIGAVSYSDFHTANSGVHVFGGSYVIRFSNFDNAKVTSESLSGMSKISGSVFSGASSGIDDFSLVEIAVANSSFVECDDDAAIDKRGGRISVSCSDFETFTGIRSMDAYVNISSTELAGYNNFSGTQHGVRLINASGINLYKGKNIFSTNNAFYISGTLNIPCTKKHGCQRILDASSNHWGVYSGNQYQPSGGGNLPPNPAKFDVFTSDAASCMQLEYASPCPVLFYDPIPVSPTPCPTKIKPEVKSLLISTHASSENETTIDDGFALKDYEVDPDNPLLNTESFAGIALDSALVYTAMQLEAYDSLANDANAIKLFHEILTSGIDMTNSHIRSKMNWATQYMKGAIENMFYQQELLPENNETTFQIPVQQYVDVLNLLTDTALTDSTYQAQFYLELDKGQLFRTIGKLDITRQIFAHLNDCNMDSLEQSVLNAWRQQVELELNRIEDYYLLDLPMDSLTEAVDTTNYDDPILLTTSDYYFGLWIDSPQSITFVQCGDHPYYRWLWNDEGNMFVYPNPTSGELNITGLNDDLQYDIRFMDLTGRCVLNIKAMRPSQGRIQGLMLPDALSDGAYMLQVVSGSYIHETKIMISK
ncbi:MAG: T9SS type A sorting domain-containing protein [Flavobacteriales bacterium]|nr:T9SS type A sorting domain-containing protein [Flavobacteriales bacterium]